MTEDTLRTLIQDSVYDHIPELLTEEDEFMDDDEPIGKLSPHIETQHPRLAAIVDDLIETYIKILECAGHPVELDE